MKWLRNTRASHAAGEAGDVLTASVRVCLCVSLCVCRLQNWQTSDQKLLLLGMSMRYEEPQMWLDLGDIWLWPKGQYRLTRCFGVGHLLGFRSNTRAAAYVHLHWRCVACGWYLTDCNSRLKSFVHLLDISSRFQLVRCMLATHRCWLLLQCWCLSVWKCHGNCQNMFCIALRRSNCSIHCHVLALLTLIVHW